MCREAVCVVHLCDGLLNRNEAPPAEMSGSSKNFPCEALQFGSKAYQSSLRRGSSLANDSLLNSLFLNGLRFGLRRQCRLRQCRNFGLGALCC